MSKTFTRAITTGTVAHFTEWDLSGTAPVLIQEDELILDRIIKDKEKAARIVKKELALTGTVTVQRLTPKTKRYTCSLDDFLGIAAEVED